MNQSRKGDSSQVRDVPFPLPTWGGGYLEVHQVNQSTRVGDSSQLRGVPFPLPTPGGGGGGVVRTQKCTKSTSQEKGILLISGVFHSLSLPGGRGGFRSATSQQSREGDSSQLRGVTFPLLTWGGGGGFRNAPIQPLFSAQGCTIAWVYHSISHPREGGIYECTISINLSAQSSGVYHHSLSLCQGVEEELWILLTP